MVDQVRKVQVDSHRGQYEVSIGAGIIERLLGNVLTADQSSKFFIVTDENVNCIYGNQLMQLMNTFAKGRWNQYVCAAGERSKSFNCLVEILEKMAELGYNRQDVIIAFGGGVVGDLAGYAASSYMRGIRFLQVPTTLLAMVDSSVGGKVAVNLNHGKNLAGAFYSPNQVICDIELLNTLSSKELSSGMAEVVKYGFVKNPGILENCRDIMIWMGKRESRTVLDGSEWAPLEKQAIIDLVTSCIISKAEIVAVDEYEAGLRMLLNYGHTFGHAIESAYGYEKYSHGDAVALGMLIAERLAEFLGFSFYEGDSSDLLKGLGLPVNWKQELTHELLPYITRDKKQTENGIKMVFIEEPGKPFLRSVSTTQIEAFLAAIKMDKDVN